jgi:pilus assembly protein CpaD
MINSKFLMVAGLGFALTGCSSMGTNTSMYSVHQPVVERTNYAIDVDASGGMVSASETQRMAEWFEAMQLSYGDHVAVDYGDGYAAPGLRQTVNGLLEDYGLLVGDTPPVTEGAVAPGTVRVIITRSKASVPSCPDWSKQTLTNYNSGNHSNYGCSVNSNLAAMIADPEDLIRGRETKAIDANSGKKAVNAYRAKTNGGN